MTGGSTVTLSIDAMGGDRAPQSVIGGLAKLAKQDPHVKFILHGDEPVLSRLLKRRRFLLERVDLRHCAEVVEMDEKPTKALRRRANTSMWHALESVRTGEASAAVSAGNTGALMAMALFCLRAAKGVDRPAIAALWPTTTETGHCVALDMGADIRADARDLTAYAAMGAEYARIALNLKRPRVALLNVGTEENKGRPEIREAADLLRAAAAAPGAAFEFTGFTEANKIPGGANDVVVSDGFTGNIALKAAEGAARFVGGLVKETFTYSFLSRCAALLAVGPLHRLKRRIDPRRVNGGVFLGLNGLVVKSHGSADATGFAAALELAARMARADFVDRLSVEVEKAIQSTHSAAMATTDHGEGGAAMTDSKASE